MISQDDINTWNVRQIFFLSFKLITWNKRKRERGKKFLICKEFHQLLIPFVWPSHGRWHVRKLVRWSFDVVPLERRENFLEFHGRTCFWHLQRYRFSAFLVRRESQHQLQDLFGYKRTDWIKTLSPLYRPISIHLRRTFIERGRKREREREKQIYFTGMNVETTTQNNRIIR